MAVTRVQIPSGVVSVLTAVQHFQRWHRNDVFVPIGQVTVKRYFALSSNGFGCSDGDTQNGIGAESFIGSAVKLNYLLIETGLVGRIAKRRRSSRAQGGNRQR